MELVRGSTNAKIGAIGRMDKTLQVCYCLRKLTWFVSLLYQVKNHLKSIRFHWQNLKFEDLKNKQRTYPWWASRFFVEDVSYIEGEAEIGLKQVFKRESSSCYFEHFSYDVLRIDRVVLQVWKKEFTSRKLANAYWPRNYQFKECLTFIEIIK
jgi:23S rRNA pseudouridine2605 synthase